MAIMTDWGGLREQMALTRDRVRDVPRWVSAGRTLDHFWERTSSMMSWSGSSRFKMDMSRWMEVGEEGPFILDSVPLWLSLGTK